MDPTGLLDVLPPELITDILEYLPIDVLWTAARVSRELYAAAWRAGLCIDRGISWIVGSAWIPGLPVYEQMIDHAQRKDIRLGLHVVCIFAGEQNADSRSIYNAVQTAAERVFPVISAALPFLVHLSIQVPDCFQPQLDDILRSPAPRLRTFELYRASDMYGTPSRSPVPRDLFGGSAPQLRTVKLGPITLPDQPIPAFRSVSQAALTHVNVFPHIDIGSQFPGLTSLHLTFILLGRRQPVLPVRVDFAALELRALIIDDINSRRKAPLLDMVERSVDLSTIPLVERVGPRIRWNDRLLTQDTAALSMRITFRNSDVRILRVAIVPAHRRRRHVRISNLWKMDAPVPINDIPDLGTRLEYLRMDGTLIRNFLALALPFPALRSLHIDLQSRLRLRGNSWVPQDDLDWDMASNFQSRDPAMPDASSPVYTPCSALQVITLFPLEEPIIDANSWRIAFLAHALGQAQRPKADRAVLALRGLEFAESVAHELLDQTVSEIRKYAFAGRGSREDYDEGLWEPVLYFDS